MTRTEAWGIGVGAAVGLGAVAFEALRRRSGATVPGPVPGVSYSGTQLTWQPLAGATYYEIAATDASGTPVTAPILVNGQQGSDFHVTATGSLLGAQVQAVPGGAQFFAIRGCNSMGCGPWSPVQSLQTASPTPGPVTGISVTNVTATSAVVSWAPVQYATYYEFLHTDATGNPAPATAPITVNGQTGNDFMVQGTSVTITGLAPGSPLHFMIRACN